MAEVSVTCGCGRKMAQRGSDPPATYRCGCGVMVGIQVASRASCTGLAETGERCRFLPVRESAQLGVALCRSHLDGYLAMLTLIRDGEFAAEILERAEDLLLNGGRRQAARLDSAWAARRRVYAEQAVVYYVRIRDTIKIGTTGNMRARMSGLVVDEILATEPGGEDLETMRHKQFAALRIRGERFRPEPELMDHIAMIRGHFGDPVITSYRDSA